MSAPPTRRTQVLALLRERGAMTTRQLAEAMGLEFEATRSAIDTYRKEGWVQGHLRQKADPRMLGRGRIMYWELAPVMPRRKRRAFAGLQSRKSDVPEQLTGLQIVERAMASRTALELAWLEAVGIAPQQYAAGEDAGVRAEAHIA